MSSTRTSLSWLGTLTLVVGATLGTVACGAADEGTGEQGGEASEPQGLGVLMEFEGSFDGTSFSLTRKLPGLELSVAEEELGTSAQPLLGEIPSKSFAPGNHATQPNVIALEQQALVTVPGGTWPAEGCGVQPAQGVCADIALRNMFPDQVLSRAYVEITELTPTGSTTSVQVAAPGANLHTATPDALFGVSGVGNGLWRYGTLERSTPVGNGPRRQWVFTGSSPNPTITFKFKAIVRGALARPTVRASTTNNTLDAAPYYTAPGGALVSDVNFTAAASDDGRYVVFSTTARNVVAGQSTNGTALYRKDLQTGAIDIVSVATGGAVPSGCNSWRPTISADGSVVAFESTCNFGFTTSGSQVYLRDFNANTTTLVSHIPGNPNVGGTGDSVWGTVAGTSKTAVAFLSRASNLVAGRPGSRPLWDAYVYDVGTQQVARANVPTGKDPNSPSAPWPNQDQFNVSLSSDGRYVLFDSRSTNLLSTSDYANYDVFAYDRQAAGGGSAYVRKLSLQSTGAATGNATHCERAALSLNDSTVAFLCTASNTTTPIVSSPPSPLGQWHLYVRDFAEGAHGTLKMVDVSPTGAVANAPAARVQPALSRDGRLVAYLSSASNLLRSAGCQPSCMTPPSGVTQVYVFDRAASDPELQRSFLVSLIEKSASAPIPFAPLTSSPTLTPVTITGPADAAVISFTSAAPGADWTQLAPSRIQQFVVPNVDPLWQ